ncbi:MAG: phosphopantetheine-binding protein [Pseudomonadota bacterium]
MSDAVEQKVIAIIAEQAVLEPHEVALDATIDDLGLDSLGFVEAIFAIEEAFDISVPFNANEPDSGEFDVRDVRAIVAAVKGLVAQKTG